jgi:hypothetical protein
MATNTTDPMVDGTTAATSLKGHSNNMSFAALGAATVAAAAAAATASARPLIDNHPIGLVPPFPVATSRQPFFRETPSFLSTECGCYQK